MCAMNVWLYVGGLVFVWLLCCWILTHVPDTAALNEEWDLMRCQESVYLISSCCTAVTNTNYSACKTQTPRAQGLIPHFVQSYANRNSCQGSDSFSASETPPLEMLVNAYISLGFSFLSLKKSWRSYVEMKYQLHQQCVITLY